MEIKKITLPISGYTVNLKTRLTWAEKNAVEGIITSATRAEVIDGKNKQTIDGGVTQAYLRKMIETFVIDATNAAGEVVQVNLELDNMDCEDGDFLQGEVAALWANLKKK